MVISSLDNTRVKVWRKLSEKKYRDEYNLFLIEGEHLVLEAYKAGLLRELILEENTTFTLDVLTSRVTKEIIKTISKLDTPSNIIGVCAKKEENFEYGNRIVLLDKVQDPGNVGTIIRSALAFNVDTVILGTGTVDLYNEKVLRACQGMNFHLNIVTGDLTKVIPTLNMKVYGTNVVCGTDLKTVPKQKKYAVVLGNEGSGVNKDILDLCEENIYIKTNSECESLNVSIACSIILYQLN